MAKKGPFDDAMEELSEILNFIEQKKDDLREGGLPPGVEKHVQELKQFVSAFTETTEGLFREAGIDPQKLLSAKEWQQNLGKRDQRTLQSLEELKKELISRKQALQSQIAQVQKQGDQKKKKEEVGDKKKLARKKRQLKKKFRGLGDDDWMKM